VKVIERAGITTGLGTAATGDELLGVFEAGVLEPHEPIDTKTAIATMERRAIMKIKLE
jgi:hypothetical protein